MRIVYTGMFDEVIVPDWVQANGYPQPPVKRGEPVEIEDELAKRLLEQVDNWAKAPTAPARNTQTIAAE